jgi:hypothetical protein
MSLTNAPDLGLERERLRVVIATIVINVIAVSLLTFAPWSDWRTGTALNVVDNCLLVGFTVVRRDALLWCSRCWREPFGEIRGASL